MLETLIGSSLPVFIGLTLVLLGAAAWMMGRAVAESWKPRWHILPYALLLAATNRFLAFALFEERLLAPLPFVLASLVMIGIGAFAWRTAHVAKMVRQYPWLYERQGIFSYRERAGSRPA